VELVEELFSLYVLSQPRMEMGEGKLEGGERGEGRSRRCRLNFLGKINKVTTGSLRVPPEGAVCCMLAQRVTE
jgi:hypothetical protein